MSETPTCEKLKARIAELEMMLRHIIRWCEQDNSAPELEMMLRHIIRWCEQDNSALRKRHVLTAIPRMCRDALDEENHNECDKTQHDAQRTPPDDIEPVPTLGAESTNIPAILTPAIPCVYRMDRLSLSGVRWKMCPRRCQNDYRKDQALDDLQYSVRSMYSV